MDFPVNRLAAVWWQTGRYALYATGTTATPTRSGTHPPGAGRGGRAWDGRTGWPRRAPWVP